MAVHFSPWLLLLVSTAFMASYILASSTDDFKACRKSCRKFSRSFCKAPQCDRPGVGDSCKLCKKTKKKNCVKLLCREGSVGNPGSCANPGVVSAASQSGTTYTYGAMVNYTCNTGYKRTAGGNPLTCSNEKTWIGTKPTCSKISCGNPGNVSATFRSATTYTYQAMVNYTCITGYEMTDGGTTLTCGSNKTWIGTKPTCSKVSCGNPGNSNTTFQSGTTYTYGARVTYLCITGYEMSTLTCDSNKKWIGTMPNCSTTGTYNGGKKIGDCADLYKKGVRRNGVYHILLSSGAHANQAVSVYCDMQTDGGGWTVFQRRIDGSVDFYRNWENYTNGFGNVDGDYWLGFEAIHALAPADHPAELRVDLWAFDGTKGYEKYGVFSVGNSASKYTLKVGSPSGTAGDGLGYNNGIKFSTHDNEHDKDIRNCAEWTHGAWWFDACTQAHLNARYYNSQAVEGEQAGITWWRWKRNYYNLKGTRMMVRPRSFASG